VTEEVLHALERATEFAPLHDPEAVQLIRAAMKRYPGSVHFVCFDTVFHETMSEEATTYPLPFEYRSKGVRRYGFHGLSCESIVRQMRARGELPKRMVIAHLGSGCSVTALLDGRSMDTTMGLTPTGGLVMGTRSGDLDPGLVLYLLRQQKGSREEAVGSVETLLNHNSGIVALSEMPNDVRAVRLAAASGDKKAELALKVFTRSVTKAIGGFSWLLGGLDVIVFAGGIGEHDPQTRSEILETAAGLGVDIGEADPDKAMSGVQRISHQESKIQVFIVPSQEDLMIALHVKRMAGL
jgi:acetate kinase